jgi:hypothetical protein
MTKQDERNETDDHVVRIHFTDGTSELAGAHVGKAPAKVDAGFARDVNRGWDLGVGETMDDGRVIARFTAEHESAAVRAAA